MDDTPVPLDDKTKTMFLIGKLFHAIAELNKGEYHPIVDGIHGSVDLMDAIPLFDDTPGAVMRVPGEVKTTRASATNNPSDSYIEQLATYCYMTGQTLGRLYVLHIISAELVAWEIQFTVEELEEWWKEMLRRRDLILGDALPPVDEHKDWECKTCPVKQKIGCPGGKGKWTTRFMDFGDWEDL